MSQTIHVYPDVDLIDHVTDSDDCPCGPTTEAVKADDGSVGWVILHHSLDGREHLEPDHDTTTCPCSTLPKETDR